MPLSALSASRSIAALMLSVYVCLSVRLSAAIPRSYRLGRVTSELSAPISSLEYWLSESEERESSPMGTSPNFMKIFAHVLCLLFVISTSDLKLSNCGFDFRQFYNCGHLHTHAHVPLLPRSIIFTRQRVVMLSEWKAGK